MKIEKYQADLDSLIKRGNQLYNAMLFERFPKESTANLNKSVKDEKKIEEFRAALPDFSDSYQAWYSEALSFLTQLLPSRVPDFIEYYKPTKPRKEIKYGTYTVSDYLEGLTITRGWEKEKVVGPDAAIPKFRQQLKMIEGLDNRFSSTLYDLHTLVQSDLFDNELEVSEELLKKGFLRAAGAVSGVVLEGHLKEVCLRHKLKPAKKNATIADFNDVLKEGAVIETPVWRNIQFLGDLRNICDHKKDKEPTPDQVGDLIEGTRKVIKTVS